MKRPKTQRRRKRAKYILDTDTLSHLHEGNPRVSQRFQTAINAGVATTIVTKVEMLRGRIEFLLKAVTGAKEERL